jgi:serine/threonine protein kinase
MELENNTIIANKYIIQEKIGNGSFGSIYKGINQRTNEKVAIKIELIEKKTKLLKNESVIYQYLKDIDGIPNVKWFGKDLKYYYMIIPLLGESLEIYKNNNNSISLETILQIGKKMLNLLEIIHSKGLVHRDIKPDNFLFGLDNKLHLIDFGFCKGYLIDNKHVSIKKTSSLIGSVNFASFYSHEHLELSRRDDLISLGYILYYLYYGNLVWSKINFHSNYEENNNKISVMKKKIVKKMNLISFLKNFLEYTYQLSYEENPNYQFLKEILVLKNNYK